MTFRLPTAEEGCLLDALAARWSSMSPDWVRRVEVRSMDDGEMGSLELHIPESSEERKFGGRVAELCIEDSDGVDVIVSLNVDQDMMPFELDVWKVDFSPVVSLRRALEALTN